MTSFPRKVSGVHTLRGNGGKPTFAGFIGQNPRKARGNGAPRGRRVEMVVNRPSNTTNVAVQYYLTGQLWWFGVMLVFIIVPNRIISVAAWFQIYKVVTVKRGKSGKTTPSDATPQPAETPLSDETPLSKVTPSSDKTPQSKETIPPDETTPPKETTPPDETTPPKETTSSDKTTQSKETIPPDETTPSKATIPPDENPPRH